MIKTTIETIVNIILLIIFVLIVIDFSIDLYKHKTNGKGFCIPAAEIEKTLEVTPEIKDKITKIKEVVEQKYPELHNRDYTLNRSYIGVYKN